MAGWNAPSVPFVKVAGPWRPHSKVVLFTCCSFFKMPTQTKSITDAMIPLNLGTMSVTILAMIFDTFFPI